MVKGDTIKLLILENGPSKFSAPSLLDNKNRMIRFDSSLIKDFFNSAKKECTDDYDIIALDICNSKTSASKIFKQLKKIDQEIPILILCDTKSVLIAKELLDCGAENYVNKEEANKRTFQQCLVYITRRRRAELEAERLRQQLKLVEIQSLQNEAINPFNEPIRNSKTAEFLSSVNHNLRGPIHGILAFANFGIKRIDKVEKEKIVGYLERIQSCGSRLLYLVNDLIDLSKLEAGVITFGYRESNISELIVIAKNEFTKQATEKKIKLQFSTPKFNDIMEFDPHWLLIVIKNLISNAIKFSSENGDVLLELKDLGSKIQFSVIDQGVGIDEEEINKVFDKFIQCSKPKTGIDGTGLGLAICQQVIENHKGKIWLEPNSPHGLKANFLIPKKQDHSIHSSGNCSPLAKLAEQEHLASIAG